PPAMRQRLPAVRWVTAALGASSELSALLDDVLHGLRLHLGIDHAMLLMHDARRACLYTVASIGYESSGVGSEIRLGEGIIGVVARERTPIRIGYAAHEYLYSRATRRGFASG